MMAMRLNTLSREIGLIMRVLLLHSGCGLTVWDSEAWAGWVGGWGGEELMPCGNSGERLLTLAKCGCAETVWNQRVRCGTPSRADATSTWAGDHSRALGFSECGRSGGPQSCPEAHAAGTSQWHSSRGGSEGPRV